jgi:TolB protein
MSRRWPSSYLLFAAVFVLIVTSPAGSQAPGKAQSLGAVRPSNLVLPQFAVSAFDGAAGIGEIIQNDLLLGDYASKPSNASAVAAASEQDRRGGSVNLDGWVAAGVHYVLRGSVSGSSAQAELFDIASKRRLFGKTYSGPVTQQPRRLAHKIADDVVTALTNQPGIFSARICYLIDRGSGREVAVMDVDGAASSILTNEGSIVATPCWGKNGTEIYFTSYRDQNPDLYGVMLNGSRFDVSKRPGLNTSPDWSETVQRLAVCLSKDGNSEIYTMTRDGGGLARLTNTPDTETAPAWSPDGSQIAFTSDRQGSPQIFIMSANGGGARPLTSGGYFDSATWSPDGKKIAFVARESGEFNVYVVDIVAGGAPLQLTRGQRDNEDPSWAPDSKHLVFSSNRSGNKELYIMSIDTRVAHQITRGGGRATSPNWGPLLP